MTIEEFNTIYLKCMALRAEEKNAEAEQLLKQALEQLSSEQKQSLLTEIATIALEDEARERDATADMQEKTLAAYSALEKIKTDIEAESGEAQAAAA